MGPSGDGGFARWWTELVADLADPLPGGVAGLAVLVLLAAAAVVAFLYWWPARHRTRRRPRPAKPVVVDELLDDDDTLPERPPEELSSLADRYAAAGRYAEAVRERLRAIVRELVDRGVVAHEPGWTVTELAAAAGAAEPALTAPMREAAAIFSDIWYGGVPAGPGHDARMRELATAVAPAPVAGETR